MPRLRKENTLWPTCEHGYYITPSHKCPWCFDGDTSKYRRHEGLGNGWLLEADGLACEGCGGPRGAGWGAWSGPDPPTKERYEEQLRTIAYCYSCTSDGFRTDNTSKKGETLSAREQRLLAAKICPDCGKSMFESGICPRLTCGSRFDGDMRMSNAAPDEPPRKTIEL